jgi:ketosteroid isomerase-like protein
MNNQQIAQAFSAGRFSECYPFLADDVRWEVIGERLLTGKEAVMQFCDQTAAYFASVSTQFQVHNVIAQHDAVAINGHATFVTADNRTIEVSSCDVYRFEAGLLKEITSYCITLSKGD